MRFCGHDFSYRMSDAIDPRDLAGKFLAGQDPLFEEAHT
jgi:hypothetical protein